MLIIQTCIVKSACLMVSYAQPSCMHNKHRNGYLDMPFVIKCQSLVFLATDYPRFKQQENQGNGLQLLSESISIIKRVKSRCLAGC